MSGANRRAEFFALEASEYVAELAPLAARVDSPDPERLVRGARALRGAALMAGLGTFARAAAALEGLARQVRDHAIGWDPHARAGWREGLDTLRSLIGRATTWEAADDRQALALAERIERISTGQTGTVTSAAVSEPAIPPGAALTPGVRAFIARESSLIAGTLLEAARALAPMPPSEALTSVLERMRSLRGLGASGELSPLPELLDAMEMTTRSLLGETPAPPGVASVFADAADALGVMAKSVAEHGRVAVPPGLDIVARRLLELFAGEDDVVAIADLAPPGQTHLVRRGSVGGDQGSDEPLPVELVGVGDHLLLQAEALARYTSPGARDLRLFVLHRTLASMPGRGGTGRFLAPIAGAITRAIGSGAAVDSPDRFLGQLRDAGRFLVDAAEAAPLSGLVSRRDQLAREIDPADTAAPAGDDLSGTPIIPIAALAPADGDRQADQDGGAVIPIDELDFSPSDDPEVVEIADLAPDPLPVPGPMRADLSDIVPIAALAPVEDHESIVPIATLAPDDEVRIPDTAPGAPSRLELAYARREALGKVSDDGPPTLAGLIGEPVIAIDDLLLRGERALARAEEVRAGLSAILAEPTVSLERLRPLLDELLDLVPLARDAA
jgi:hypothetical protein